jgi:hypothetical protein
MSYITRTRTPPTRSYGYETISPGVTALWIRDGNGWTRAGTVTRTGAGNTLRLDTGTEIIRGGNYEEIAWKVKHV